MGAALGVGIGVIAAAALAACFASAARWRHPRTEAAANGWTLASRESGTSFEPPGTADQ